MTVLVLTGAVDEGLLGGGRAAACGSQQHRGYPQLAARWLLEESQT